MGALFASVLARLGLVALIPGAAGIMAAAANVFAAVVAFFSTRLGRWVGVALIAVAIFLYSDARRYRLDMAWHRAEIARLNAAFKTLQERIRREVEGEVQERIARLERENEERQKRLEEYEIELKKRGGAACLLTPDDVGRLRPLDQRPDRRR